MPAKIEMDILNGKLLPASREMIEQQLEEFADAHRRLKTLIVSLDIGNPARAVAEIKAPLGQQTFVSKATANSASEAVEDAIVRLHRQLWQRLQDRKELGEQQAPVDRDAHIMKVSKGVAAILLASIFAVTMTRMDSCTYNPANYPETASVSGTVTLDGQPLEGAMVSFVPSQGRASNGKTDADGNFTLHYTGAIEGAVLGTHRVMISKWIPDPDYEPSKEELAMFEATVPSGVLESSDVEMQAETVPMPAPMIDAIPPRYHGTASELSAEVKDAGNSFDFSLTSK